MFLKNVLLSISIADAGILAVLGYGVVFFGLVLLMVVVTVLGKYFASKKDKEVK